MRDFSDGGQVALELGTRYPDLPGALVLGAAWFRFSEQYQDGIRGFGLEGLGSSRYGGGDTAAAPSTRRAS